MFFVPVLCAIGVMAAGVTLVGANPNARWAPHLKTLAILQGIVLVVSIGVMVAASDLETAMFQVMLFGLPVEIVLCIATLVLVALFSKDAGSLRNDRGSEQ